MSDTPSYMMYDLDGRLWNIPSKYVVGNVETKPYRVSADECRVMQPHMVEFEPSNFFHGWNGNPHHIVCVGRLNPDATDPAHKYDRLFWCVRFEFWPGTTSHAPFGKRFLWPFRKSNAIWLHGHLPEPLLSTPERNALVEKLRPCKPRVPAYGFVPEEWPGVTPVTHLPNTCDRIFAMTVRPRTYASLAAAVPEGLCPDEAANDDDAMVNMLTERMEKVATTSVLAFSNLDDSAQYAVVNGLVDQLLKACRVDVLMQLRCASKPLRNLVDECALQIVCNLVKLVHSAHDTHLLADVHAARDALLEYHLSPMRLVLEVTLARARQVELGIHTFVRAQRDKVPQATPPCFSRVPKRSRS